MCGIAGEVPWSGVDYSAAICMVARLQHRGPHRRSTDLSPTGRCALAHARLRIIDIGTGELPISNENESVWVVFNGEIYNPEPIRSMSERHCGATAAYGHQLWALLTLETWLERKLAA